MLVVHEWTGHNAYARKRDEQFADLCYVAFALDMYGKGVFARDARDVAARAKVFKEDRALMRARASAGLDVLRRNPHVDADRLAAVGSCFGGTNALELARGGTGLRGVVSFHGNLATPHPADAKRIRGRVLVLNGADDPVVPPGEVEGFEKEMKGAGIVTGSLSIPARSTVLPTPVRAMTVPVGKLTTPVRTRRPGRR